MGWYLYSISLIIFFIFLNIYFVSAIICNPNLPNGCPEEIQQVTTSTNYSLVNVNNSIYLQGYTPTTLGTYLQGLMGWITGIISGDNYLYRAGDEIGFNETKLNDTFVPYTGAVSDVSLGSHYLRADTGIGIGIDPVIGHKGLNVYKVVDTDAYTYYGSDVELSIAPHVLGGNRNIFGVQYTISPYTTDNTAYGIYLNGNSLSSINNPSVNQIGMFLNWNIAGTDTSGKRWTLYNSATKANSGKIFLGGDNIKTYWGSSADHSVYSDGVNLVVNPKETGSGELRVLGNTNITGNITATSYCNSTVCKDISQWGGSSTSTSNQWLNTSTTTYLNSSYPQNVNITGNFLTTNNITSHDGNFTGSLFVKENITIGNNSQLRISSDDSGAIYKSMSFSNSLSSGMTLNVLSSDAKFSLTAYQSAGYFQAGSETGNPGTMYFSGLGSKSATAMKFRGLATTFSDGGSAGYFPAPIANNPLQVWHNISGTTFALDFAVSNKGNVNISNNLIVGGRVGIGTSNPTDALNVVGNGNFTGNATIGQLLTLQPITLPSVSVLTNGSIARNITDNCLYYENGTGWSRFVC